MLRIAREKPQDHTDWHYYTFMVSNLGASMPFHSPYTLSARFPIWTQWCFNLTIFFSFLNQLSLPPTSQKKLSLWSLRPQLIPCSLHLHPPPPPTHTSLSIPTFIHTCFSQVSKVKVYIFLFKAPSFCAFDFIACCLLQDYTLFCYFHALFSLSCSSYPRGMFMGLAFLNEQSNNTSHRPPHTFPILFPTLLLCSVSCLWRGGDSCFL